MSVKQFAVLTSVLALVVIASIAPLWAQGPMYDKVTVGDKTLEPGDYVIQELPSSAKSNVLLLAAPIVKCRIPPPDG